MKKLIYILLSALVAFLIGSCSPAEIRQAQVMTQSEIDEYNKQFENGEEPENPDPENPDPENPDPENPDPENPDPEDPGPRITDGSAIFVGETAQGLKDGTSWAHCLDAAGLRALIAQRMNGAAQDDEAAFAQAQALDGVKIYLTGGKFVMADSQSEAKVVKLEWNGYKNPVKLYFYGGYNPASQGIDLTDRNESTYETVFSGDISGNGSVDAADARIFLLGNQTDLSFDGITFAHAFMAGNGAALTLAAGNSGQSKVTLTKCIFRDNVTDSNSSGAALLVQKGTLVANNCTFTGNGAKNGSVLSSANSAADSKFTSCTFTSNTSSNCGGVMNLSKGKVEFDSCQFQGNKANGYAGGALHVNGSGVTLLCKDCTFSANESSQHGGAVSLEQGTVTLQGCTLSGNRSALGKEGSGSHGGAVAMLKSNGVMNLSGCTFSGNESAGNASAVYMNYGRLYIHNSSFADNHANNRGTLRLNNGLCYMNHVSVSGSSVDGDWGLAIQCTGLGALCMNNVTLGNSKGTIGTNNCTLNGTFNGLIVNSTVVDSSPLAMLRVEGGKKQVLLNSMLVNLSGTPGIYYAGDDEITSLGSCIIGTILGNDTAARAYNAGTGDVTGVSAASLGLAWDATKGLYTWNGTAEGHTRMAASSIEGLARTALPISVKGEVDGSEAFKVTNVSDDFCNWVNSVESGAFAKDALGHARSGDATCGAWQKE